MFTSLITLFSAINASSFERRPFNRRISRSFEEKVQAFDAPVELRLIDPITTLITVSVPGPTFISTEYATVTQTYTTTETLTTFFITTTITLADEFSTTTSTITEPATETITVSVSYPPISGEKNEGKANSSVDSLVEPTLNKLRN
jgi:hypothetical protein